MARFEILMSSTATGSLERKASGKERPLLQKIERRLSTHPERYGIEVPYQGETARFADIDEFYRMLYRIDEQQHCVEVLDVLTAE